MNESTLPNGDSCLHILMCKPKTIDYDLLNRFLAAKADLSASNKVNKRKQLIFIVVLIICDIFIERSICIGCCFGQLSFCMCDLNAGIDTKVEESLLHRGISVSYEIIRINLFILFLGCATMLAIWLLL